MGPRTTDYEPYITVYRQGIELHNLANRKNRLLNFGLNCRSELTQVLSVGFYPSMMNEYSEFVILTYFYTQGRGPRGLSSSSRLKDTSRAKFRGFGFEVALALKAAGLGGA